VKQYSLLAYCGLYCGGCRSYQENSDVGCKGCRDEKTLVNDCPTRECAMRKGILHCGECESFPCELLDGFYKDGHAHHALAYDNILKIRLSGAEEWLTQQETEHTCTCGKRRLWFAKECTHDSK
jgi:hypothetical protein